MGPASPQYLFFGDRLSEVFSDAARQAADQAKKYFDRVLDKIEQQLERTRGAIQDHNQKMARQLAAAVARRRAKLQEDQLLGTSIGYPIKKRPDADSYSVPLTRRKLTLGRSAHRSEGPNAYVPEPAIDDADYEAVLTVLKNARNALAGRSDILVREGDRNVFIGECKIYDPKLGTQGMDALVTGALNQLLCYLVWRDTKAALVLFIRDTDVSDAIRKALAAIGRHPNYLRHGRVSTEERHDFVLHANDDKNREIRLAFLPFLIATKTVKRVVEPRTTRSVR